MQQEDPLEVESYQELSSEEVVVEFCQLENDLIGASISTNNIINGTFGSAQLLQTPQDKLIVLNTQSKKLKLIDKVYRAIIIKRNKKKEIKSKEEAQKDEIFEEQEKQAQRSEQMFESSSENKQIVKKKAVKRKIQKKEKVSTARIIRKLRDLSKQKQKK